MEISHRLPIADKILRKLPQSSLNDGVSIKSLHRYTHRLLNQRHTHKTLQNDVITMEISHRLHISSKVHENDKSM